MAVEPATGRDVRNGENPMFDNWKIWVEGLISAFVGGASNVIAMVIVDPLSFNFTTQWRHTAGAALAGGVLAVAMYLKTPQPTVTSTTRTVTEKVTETAKPDVPKDS